MFQEINPITDYSKVATSKDFENGSAVVDGIIYRLIQMSEHMAYISEDFKKEHSDIARMHIKGFRNRLVHDYGVVNLKFVKQAAFLDNQI